MKSDFVVFGSLHLTILVAGLAFPFLLARLTRSVAVLRALAVALLIGELLWYPSLFLVYGNHFPYGLPFQLCGYSAIAGIVGGLTRRQAFLEFAYFAGVAGAAMALLTPDLFAPTASYPSIYFFISHVLIVGIPLYAIASGLFRPSPGSPLRTLLAVTILAIPTGLFNAAFGTNYMYLYQKPAAGSAMDLMGPWPYYLPVIGVVAAALFGMLYAPFGIATSTAGRAHSHSRQPSSSGK